MNLQKGSRNRTRLQCRSPPAGELGGGPAPALQDLSLPVLQVIFGYLKTIDQVECCQVSPWFTAALGDLVTTLELDLARHQGCLDPTPNSPPSYLKLTKVHSLLLKMSVKLASTENDDAAADNHAPAWSAPLRHLLGSKALRRLKVDTFSSDGAEMLLDCLPLCTGLEDLDLDMNSLPESVCAAVARCRFPCLQALCLSGRLLTPAGADCPMGLLHIWDQDPALVANLRTLRLRYPDFILYHRRVMINAPTAWPALVTWAQRLAGLPDKHLEELELVIGHGQGWQNDHSLPDVIAYVAAGVCRNAPGLTTFRCSAGRAQSSAAAVQGILATVAPGRAAPLRALHHLCQAELGPLVQAMRGGRLQELRDLRLGKASMVCLHHDPAGPLVELLACLAGEPSLCPRLSELELRGGRALGALLKALGQLLAMPERGIRIVRLVGERENERTPPRCPNHACRRVHVDDESVAAFTQAPALPHLQSLSITETYLSLWGTASILRMLHSKCPQPSLVCFTAAVCGPNDWVTKLADVQETLADVCSREQFLQHPGKALGLGDVCLMEDPDQFCF